MRMQLDAFEYCRQLLDLMFLLFVKFRRDLFCTTDICSPILQNMTVITKWMIHIFHIMASTRMESVHGLSPADRRRLLQTSQENDGVLANNFTTVDGSGNYTPITNAFNAAPNNIASSQCLVVIPFVLSIYK